MFNIQNYMDNDDIKIVKEKGAFRVLEYQRDLSVTPGTAATAYFSSMMNVRKRQVVCNLPECGVTLQAGAMQWMVGNGLVALEPTYKHIILVDMNDWGDGVVLEDGLFLACESSLQHKTVMRGNFSSALGGGEGPFNLCLVGQGVAVLESNVPEEELIAIDLNNDTLKIDGNMAIAWSPSLQFTVERSGKSLIGSAASGEGLVNVYRGSGRVLMAPVS